MKRYLAFLLITLISISALAQSKKESKAKTATVTVVLLSPYSNSASVKFEPHATLICNGDSIKDNGTHTFRKVPVGKVMILAEAEGFIPVIDSLMVEQGADNERFITMTDRIVDLQMVVVNGTIPALVYRNDTLKFTPDGMNFADDDAAREVLRRMPGVEFSEGQIKVGGKPIMKTYVDGRTSLFGDNPMTAIDHIKATDVAHIYAYDEDEHPEEENPNHKGGRHRVLNIVTKSKMLNSYDGVLFGGVGPTLGETLSGNDLRYAGGGSFNFFSDKWLLKLDAMQNNQNSNSTSPSRYFTTESPASTYSENSILGAKLERKWQGKKKGKDTSLSGEYNFSRIAPESMSYSETNYTPLPGMSYTERQYISQDLTTSQDNRHVAKINFSSKTDKYGNITANYSMNVRHHRDMNESEDLNILDGVKMSDVRRINNSRKAQEHEADFSFKRNLGRKWQYMVKGNYSSKNEDNTENRFTNLDNRVSELFIPEDNRGGKWDLQFHMTFDTLSYKVNEDGKRELGSSNSLAAIYNFRSDNRHLTRVAEDLSTGLLDEVNTYSFRNQLTENLFALKWRYMNNKRKFMTSIKAGVNNAVLTDKRRDYSLFDYNKNFLMPDVDVTVQQLGLGGFYLNYTLEGSVPEVPQIRRVLDNQNPLYLRVGNQDLKQAATHSVLLSYTKWKGGISGSHLNIFMQANLTDNYIISKTTYFGKDTYLDEYNYWANAGSSLSTFANVSNRRSLSLYASWSQPLSAIKSGYKLSMNLRASHTPYYYNVMDAINGSEVAGTASIYTDRIKNTHLELAWKGNYSKSDYQMSDRDNEIMTNRLAFTGNVKNILKVGFLKFEYVYNQNHFITRHANDADQMLNIYAGVNLKHGIELSMTAYDLLNSDSGRKWSVSENYSRLSYRENFGRYISFNLKWNLSKVKSNRNVGDKYSTTTVNGVMVVTYSD